jgi:hypothetical protein
MAAVPDRKTDHKEAVRLSRAYWHMPVGVFLLGSILLSGVASAASTMWSVGPRIPIP